MSIRHKANPYWKFSHRFVLSLRQMKNELCYRDFYTFKMEWFRFILSQCTYQLHFSHWYIIRVLISSDLFFFKYCYELWNGFISTCCFNDLSFRCLFVGGKGVEIFSKIWPTYREIKTAMRVDPLFAFLYLIYDYLVHFFPPNSLYAFNSSR